MGEGKVGFELMKVCYHASVVKVQKCSDRMSGAVNGWCPGACLRTLVGSRGKAPGRSPVSGAPKALEF